MAHHPFQTAGIALDIECGSLIPFALGELEQLGRLPYSAEGAVDLPDIAAQTRALATQILRALLIGPDGGIFQLAAYLLQAFLLPVVLKETPLRS
jgi:hypothetical protein